MRKLFLIIALVIASITTNAQAISDMAIIPIGVTLNSIARLTINSGGNIEFMVNTMDKYEKGIEPTSSTTTTFSVSSSCAFAVTLQSDADNLIGVTNKNNMMSSQFIGFKITGGENQAGTGDIVLNTVEGLLSATKHYVVGTADDNYCHAGTFNNIQILWKLHPNVDDSQFLTSFPSDRYVINAMLQMVQKKN